MKALFGNELYVALGDDGANIQLERVDSDERITVSLASPSLIIDPTDGDIDEAEGLRNSRSHCCDCPHVTYLTIDIEASRHECESCGEVFTDPRRTKIYFR